MMEETRLITMEEFCDMLQIGRNTAYILLNSGKVSGIWKIGRNWKITEQAVKEYIKTSMSAEQTRNND